MSRGVSANNARHSREGGSQEKTLDSSIRGCVIIRPHLSFRTNVALLNEIFGLNDPVSMAKF